MDSIDPNRSQNTQMGLKLLVYEQAIVPRRYFFCGSFMFLFCLVYALMSLYASVYMCFVVTCWERADLLALVCGV